MVIKTTHIDNLPSRIAFSKRSELRKVLMFILDRDLKTIKNKSILEIGCGNWNYAKDIVEQQNSKWYGLEPVDFKKENITLIKGSVKNIPYHDNSFDYVICNQTMEHWFEYGVSFKKALSEINRVLKFNGVLMVNVPIHLHGHPYFLQGKLNKIKKLFQTKSWKIILFEKCIPETKERKWKKIAHTGFFSHFGYPDFLIPSPKKSFSYILNIHVVKKNLQRKKTNFFNFNYGSFRPMLVLLRFIKEYLLVVFKLK